MKIWRDLGKTHARRLGEHYHSLSIKLKLTTDWLTDWIKRTRVQISRSSDHQRRRITRSKASAVAILACEYAQAMTATRRYSEWARVWTDFEKFLSWIHFGNLGSLVGVWSHHDYSILATEPIQLAIVFRRNDRVFADDRRRTSKLSPINMLDGRGLIPCISFLHIGT